MKRDKLDERVFLMSALLIIKKNVLQLENCLVFQNFRFYKNSSLIMTFFYHKNPTQTRNSLDYIKVDKMHRAKLPK